MRSVRVGMLAAGVCVMLTGCASQISALAPVGGDDMTGVRIAATDVLLEQNLDILTAPVCTQEAKIVTCAGTLTDGTVVDVKADVAPTPNTMTVTAGGKVLYQGSVEAVLDRAAGAGAS